ncbi:MAG: phospholipase, partial [Nanoarchaeota archaeon]|nr:phospholipase [Nanoarchaeota archaeon]
KFLYDLSYINNNLIYTNEQEIFNEIFQSIENANKFILIDMFLFNNNLGALNSSYRGLSSELINKLITKKKENPNINIIIISDEINNFYTKGLSEQFNKLKENNIQIHITNLNILRDSNPLYSSIWRTFIQWFGKSESGILPHAFDKNEKVGFRSYLKLLNFKANHRKTFISDDGSNSYISIITSANPHDGSSAHSNVAVKIKGEFASEIYKTETTLLKSCKSCIWNTSQIYFEKVLDYDLKEYNNEDLNGNLKVKLITENKIEKALISSIKSTSKGDTLDIGIFYISDRDIINQIIDASNRGVNVRIILDPNKDAFGMEKGGIPNRQVASELIKKSNGKIKIKWYNTNGEQFHSKFIFIQKTDGTNIIILGSANFTVRNIGDYNLETNILVTGKESSKIFQEMHTYYNKIWNNENDNIYTLKYDSYKDETRWKYWFYRFQEWSGLSTY